MLNQTIYNLARQADTLARVLEPDLRETVRYNRIRDEKFAELIVRECAGLCSDPVVVLQHWSLDSKPE